MRVEDAMHQIVQTTHAIFNVDGAGLMLADVDHHLLNAAVSDERMRHLEELQIRHQEGPCIAAFEDKDLVRAEDLTEEMRWPSFSKHAVTRGIRAVLASPIPYNQDAVGVVAVTSEDSRPGRPRRSSRCWRSPTWPPCSSPACCSASSRPSWPPSCSRR